MSDILFDRNGGKTKHDFYFSGLHGCKSWKGPLAARYGPPAHFSTGQAWVVVKVVRQNATVKILDEKSCQPLLLMF